MQRVLRLNVCLIKTRSLEDVRGYAVILPAEWIGLGVCRAHYLNSQIARIPARIASSDNRA